jgi:hypothetical protein
VSAINSASSMQESAALIAAAPLLATVDYSCGNDRMTESSRMTRYSSPAM